MASYDSAHHYLLLLPPPPSEISISTLRATYGPGLTSVFRELTPIAHERSCLDIAVQTEDAGEKRPRSSLYDRHQDILANLYRLIAILATEGGINIDSESSVDVRIVFVVDDSAREGPSRGVPVPDALTLKGPVIPLETLALSNRPWARVYSIEGEEAQALLDNFIKQRKAVKSKKNTVMIFEVRRVPGGPCIKISQNKNLGKDGRPHSSIAVGGTFDHLHLGHRLLLSMTAFLVDTSGTAAARIRSITVGITGDELLKNKKYAGVLESWEERQTAVYRFLSSIISFDHEKEPSVERFNNEGPNGKAVHYTFDDDLTIKCVEISDPYGPTVTDESITALVVSGETRAGGQAVNTKRGEKQWDALDVFEVGVLDAGVAEESATSGTEAFASKISSTEIRRRLHERSSAN